MKCNRNMNGSNVWRISRPQNCTTDIRKQLQALLIDEVRVKAVQRNHVLSSFWSLSRTSKEWQMKSNCGETIISPLDGRDKQQFSSWNSLRLMATRTALPGLLANIDFVVSWCSLRPIQQLLLSEREDGLQAGGCRQAGGVIRSVSFDYLWIINLSMAQVPEPADTGTDPTISIVGFCNFWCGARWWPGKPEKPAGSDSIWRCLSK